MDTPQIWISAGVLAPAALMAVAALFARIDKISIPGLWRVYGTLSGLALAFAAVSALVVPGAAHLPAAFRATSLGLLLALLVQVLGSVIGSFSARYLQGEAGQRRYVASLAAVLSAVHLLLLADHWWVLIAAWALVGFALQQLLCFYPERAFAQLAAYKKNLADRLADVLLVAAAALAWTEVGSFKLSDLFSALDQQGMTLGLQLCALALVVAVVLRTALLPVHGWLIQVMEAPSPVSALLHAGVINLGGFVLIRFAPLLEQASLARWLLLAAGLATAVLAGMVMLTRISIKVRLAWSTVAQMGFMLLECALGLYTLAALHLIGHSLYKAHAFLSASDVVRRTRLRSLHQPAAPAPAWLALAPLTTVATLLAIEALFGPSPWPWWWSAILGLAWAPLLWLPLSPAGLFERSRQVLSGLAMVLLLTAAARLLHALPLSVEDKPQDLLGQVALLGMAALYLGLSLLQLGPAMLSGWWRWSYAGFYVDEVYTRVALRLWPARWMPQPRSRPAAETAPSMLSVAP